MASIDTRDKAAGATVKQHSPVGRTKIMEALTSLLAEKEFSAITIGEIARTAGVTEPLIYKYFQGKRDVLHQVLADFLAQYMERILSDLDGIADPLDRLRRLIWGHISMYNTERVFARILILEVRNSADYFRSDAYRMVKRYTQTVLHLIEEGVTAGLVRTDVPAKALRQYLMGAVEFACLPGVIHGGDISPDELTDNLSAFIFDGIRAREPRRP